MKVVTSALRARPIQAGLLQVLGLLLICIGVGYRFGVPTALIVAGIGVVPGNRLTRSEANVLGRLLPRESRAVSYQALWANDDWPDVEHVVWSGDLADEGAPDRCRVRVHPVVRRHDQHVPGRCVHADVGVAAAGATPGLDSEPYPGITWPRHVQQGLVSLLVNGSWYTQDPQHGRDVIGLVVLDPQRVEPHQRPDGSIYFLIDGVTPVRRDDMIHITELVLPGQA